MVKILLSSSFITALVMVLNFLFKIYLSYQFNKETLGIFYTFLDVVAIGTIFFSGFKDSLIKAYDEKDFEAILFWYIVGFWVLFIVVLIGEIEYYRLLDLHYSLWMLVSIFFVNALMIFFSYLNAAYKVYKVMLFENLIMSLGLFVGYSIFALFMKGVEVLFFSFLFSFVSRIIYILIFSKVKVGFTVSRLSVAINFFKNTFLSSLMYFFSFLFITTSSIVIMKLFNDNEFLGEFQVVIRSVFFALVAIFVFPINTFTFPEISKLISLEQYDEVKRIEFRLMKYLLLFFFFLLFSTLFTKFFIQLIFPKEYGESYKFLNWMLPFLPFIAYTTFALNILKGFNRFELALYVRIVGSLVFFLIVGFGYFLGFSSHCVIYAFDITFLSMAILAFYYKKRLL